MKIFSPYLGCHKVQNAPSEFFRSLDKGRMWRYNVLVDNEVSVSHILRLDPITAEPILLTVKLVTLIRENHEPILTSKITKWRNSLIILVKVLSLTHPVWAKITYIFPYWVCTKTFICKSPYIKGTYRQRV